MRNMRALAIFFYRLVKIEELYGVRLPQNYKKSLFGEDAFKCTEDEGIGDEDCSRTTYRKCIYD